MLHSLTSEVPADDDLNLVAVAESPNVPEQPNEEVADADHRAQDRQDRHEGNVELGRVFEQRNHPSRPTIGRETLDQRFGRVVIAPERMRDLQKANIRRGVACRIRRSRPVMAMERSLEL